MRYRTLQAALGTNPLTLVAPGKEDTFELDMATSAVAVGKVMIAFLAVWRYCKTLSQMRAAGMGSAHSVELSRQLGDLV